jgi:hypothetical protein
VDKPTMSSLEFTEAEKRYLQDLGKLPSSIRSRVVGWGLELVPSIGLFVFGLVSESRFFLILGFLSLLYFSVWRMYSQFRGFRLIQSIYEKQLSKHDSGDG